MADPITSAALMPHLSNMDSLRQYLKAAGIDPKVIDNIVLDSKVDGGDIRYLQGRHSPAESQLLGALAELDQQGALAAQPSKPAPASAGYPDAGPLDDKKVLKRGDGGAGVNEMQTMLKDAGF